MQGLLTGAMIEFVGYVGQPVELSFSPSGKAIAKFTVAVGGGGEKYPTAWYRCVAWEEAAERLNEKITSAGMPVWVKGRYVQKAYKTKAGADAVSNDVTVDEVYEVISLTKREDLLAGLVTRGSRGNDGNGSVDGKGVDDEVVGVKRGGKKEK